MKPATADRLQHRALTEFYMELENGCRISRGKRNDTNGYHYVSGHLAHRLAYEGAKGPIPDRYVVDHMCFNRSCVNPEHLRAIPRHENTRRRNGLVFPFGQCRWGHPLSEQKEYARPGVNRKHCGACQQEINDFTTAILKNLRLLEITYGLGDWAAKRNYGFALRTRQARVDAVRDARLAETKVAA